MQGSPKQLLAEHIEDYVLELTDPDTDEAVLKTPLRADIRKDSSGQIVRFYSNDMESLKIVADKIRSSQFYLRQSNLEDVFLKATGRMLNERQ